MMEMRLEVRLDDSEGKDGLEAEFSGSIDTQYRHSPEARRQCHSAGVSVSVQSA